MKLFNINTWKDVLMHGLLIVAFGFALILFFFYIYLPNATNHGETITVPDVRGELLEDLETSLSERNLRYEITRDSGFSADLPPLTVLKQLPLPNSKVKENRKIYITLNAENPPLIRMPKIVGGSVKNAALILKTYDLKLGDIIYIPDPALNYVFEQRINGRQINEGERVQRGSVIDLVAGDGLGRVTLESPNLIALDQEAAEFAIVGSGLKVGRIKYEKEGIAVIAVESNEGEQVYTQQHVPPGTVFKQEPEPGTIMRLEDQIDIWIYRPDSLNANPTMLNDL